MGKSVFLTSKLVWFLQLNKEQNLNQSSIYFLLLSRLSHVCPLPLLCDALLCFAFLFLSFFCFLPGLLYRLLPCPLFCIFFFAASLSFFPPLPFLALRQLLSEQDCGSLFLQTLQVLCGLTLLHRDLLVHLRFRWLTANKFLRWEWFFYYWEIQLESLIFQYPGRTEHAF